ncbi:dentin sialophosphoprotein [Thalictrum thalictroides]|uniref:Dentin sialophosphoprotein n=1 Tax=Thalictrum thalictroides TaxID=46969 RepID=A0A7J6VD49_THATH|nr:dentin sialophosphoprotein [Thalictrum thalictroides]
MGLCAAWQNLVQMWRTFVFSVRASYQWVCNHLIILGAILILYIVYSFLPSVLLFFISSCPILICTAVLLNALLSFGYVNDAQAEEKRVYETSRNAHDIKKHDDFHTETRLKRRNNIRERALEKSGIINGGKISTSRERKVTFSGISRDGLLGRKARIEEQQREIPSVSGSEIDMQDQVLVGLGVEISNAYDSETSNFGSDKAECSSTDTPPMNVLPVVDEIDPLLDSKPQPAPTSPDEFDGALESSDRSIDGSADSETENQEETQGNEEDGATAAVTWTKDDEKNLMDLGTSEMERNQRLENLIAKRRARKIMSKVIEKNLIDFDSNEPPLVQIPSITKMKSNPFDVPYLSSEIDGLPPIPGSAPSVLVPRGNPFDLPYDPQEEKPDLTHDSFQQEYTPTIFCRHESFSLGSSFTGGMKHEKYNTRFTPYFAPESSEGIGYSGSLAQFGEKHNSLPRSGPESELLPPIDRKNRKKKTERALSLGVRPLNYVAQEREISVVNLLKADDAEKRDADLNKVETREVGNNLSIHDKTEAFKEPEVVKEKYKKSPFSSSTGTDKEDIDVNVDKSQPENVKPAIGDSNMQPSDSMEPSHLLEESDLDSRVLEGVDVANTKEPVYDSSPSAVEKRTIDEYLVYLDKGPLLTSTSSIASDMQVEVSEAGSPMESLDRYPSADGESSSYVGVDKNAIDLRDNVVEERELRPIEETFDNNDAVKDGVSLYELVSKDIVAAPVEPDLVVEQHGNNSNSARPPISETTEVDAKNDAPPSNTQLDIDVGSNSDLVVVDSMAPSPLSGMDKRETLPEELPVQPHFDGDHCKESQVASLKSNQEGSADDVNQSIPEDSKDNDNLISHENIEGEYNSSITVDVLENPRNEKEATMADVEASSIVGIVHENETMDNSIDRQISEASHTVDEACKQPEKEAGVLLNQNGEKSQKENEIDLDKTEVPTADTNS